MVVINTLLFLASFLRTLFFVVVFYYVFRFLIRLLAPLFGYQKANKKQQQNSGRTTRKEGDVRVEKVEVKKSKFGKDEGEYVEFEEVE